MSSLKQSLQDLIEGEVRDDEGTLHYFSNDASAFRITPDVVVSPKHSGDLKSLVDFVREQRHLGHHSISLTPRSCGTDMTGGPLSESIVVDTNRHMNHIVEIDRDYAITQPGARFRDFDEETSKHGLMLPSYPASKSIASVGGMVANNSGGEKTLRYGKTEDYVRELEVILRDGKQYRFKKLSRADLERKLQLEDLEGDVYRRIHELLRDHYEVIQKARPSVSKNSTGYSLWRVWDREKGNFDLTQLFVGSQGTLGLISEINFKLVPIEKYSKMFVIYLNGLDQLPEIVNTCRDFRPTGIESYDDKTLKLALKFFPQLALLISKSQNIFKFAVQMLPDLWITVRHGFPELVLMVEFTGNEESEIDERLEKLEASLAPLRIATHRTKSQDESEKYWIIRRESFNLLRQRVKGKQTVPFIDDFIVTPEVMPDFWPKLKVLLDQYPELVYTIAGHAGEGNYHIIPLMDMTDERQRRIIPELSEKVFDLVLEYGGSLSAEHNDGLIRGPYLKKMYGEEVFGLFRQVKEIFDPDNIFNPHKKTDASLDYSMRHLKKDNEHNV